MSMEQTYQHWQVVQDHHRVAWLTFNRTDKTLNSLNEQALNEFESILDALYQDLQLTGIVIRSGKEHGFIAGVDLDAVAQLTDVNAAVQVVRKGQFVFDKLAHASVPTIAMIEGYCLGGGLELALACRYRIALDDSKTVLGLPEIKLGIHPGWGGTVRLPRLIGPFRAFDLILTGRSVSARTAAALGLVDAAVPARQMQHAVISFLQHQPKLKTASRLQTWCNVTPIRYLLGWQLRRTVAEKALPEHYPAPYAVIDNWVQCGVHDKRALAVEASSIGKLFVSDTAKNLLRVFFLQEQLKALSKNADFSPKHVHVIGAGVMGGDIAAWCALQGLQVTLQDRAPQYIAPAIKRAADLFKKKLKLPRKVQHAMDRLLPDPAGVGIASADVMIEAIVENLEAKQTVLQTSESRTAPTTLLATNTSSIPLDAMGTVLTQADRLIGIHFFNPVASMPLVEVVHSSSTSPLMLANAIAFVRCIDRLPLPVKSSPGFLVNRILMPYLLECVLMIEEQVPFATIDQAAIHFGMPMGPVELADTVGLDVCLSVANNLAQHYHRLVPPVLVKMVEEGKLGRKSGQGFYHYKKGVVLKPKPVKAMLTEQDITERLIYPMLNEAAACLREGIVETSDLLDAGMIFGTGFAPFRGGPMHYAHSLGKEKVVATLEKLTTTYGQRFQPDPYWNQFPL